VAELNGIPAAIDHVKVLALDNYGHFTSMRVDNHRVRSLPLHLERPTSDCRTLFDAELDPGRVRHLVRHALTATSGPVLVRVTVFDPALELAHPAAKAKPHVLVTSRATTEHPLPPLRVRSAYFRRELPKVKHVGLFGLLRQRRLAQLDGFDNALFSNSRSQVCEGATWNIGFCDGESPRLAAGRLSRRRDDGLDQPISQRADQHRTSGRRARDVRSIRHQRPNAPVGIRTISAIDGTRWTDEPPLISALRKEYSDIPAEEL